MRSWKLASAVVPLERYAPSQVEQGSLETGATELLTYHGLEVGLWEMGEGIAVDVEVDELSVVLSGRGTLEIDGEDPIVLEPGVLFRLREGDRTRWTVQQRLRKLYLLPDVTQETV